MAAKQKIRHDACDHRRHGADRRDLCHERDTLPAAHLHSSDHDRIVVTRPFFPFNPFLDDDFFGFEEEEDDFAFERRPFFGGFERDDERPFFGGFERDDD
jgi:hypothetical protein